MTTLQSQQKGESCDHKCTVPVLQNYGPGCTGQLCTQQTQISVTQLLSRWIVALVFSTAVLFQESVQTPVVTAPMLRTDFQVHSVARPTVAARSRRSVGCGASQLAVRGSCRHTIPHVSDCHPSVSPPWHPWDCLKLFPESAQPSQARGSCCI